MTETMDAFITSQPNRHKGVLVCSKMLGVKLITALAAGDKPQIDWQVASFDDANDNRSAKPEIIQLCNAFQIPVTEFSSSDDLLRIFETVHPTLALAANVYTKLPENILSSTPFGVWAIHHGPLPRYRGGSPLVWQLINGEKTVYSSLFRMNQIIDGGDVLFQIKKNRRRDDNIRSTSAYFEDQWSAVIPSLLTGILSEFLSPIEQTHSSATTFPARKPSDGQLNLAWESTRILNFCAAQVDPYPGAFFCIENKKWRVLRCEKSELSGKGLEPMAINFLSDRLVVILCSDGQVLKASVEHYEL